MQLAVSQDGALAGRQSAAAVEDSNETACATGPSACSGKDLQPGGCGIALENTLIWSSFSLSQTALVAFRCKKTHRKKIEKGQRERKGGIARSSRASSGNAGSWRTCTARRRGPRGSPAANPRCFCEPLRKGGWRPGERKQRIRRLMFSRFQEEKGNQRRVQDAKRWHQNGNREAEGGEQRK